MRIKLLVAIIILFYNSSGLLFSQSVRPVRDDVGFCWSAAEMNSFMNFLSGEVNIEYGADKKLIGGISVHDDFLYAGRVYYPLFSRIRTKEVVVFGVTHGTVRKELNNPSDVLILDEHDEWIGPYGNVPVSPLREAIKSELDEKYIMVSNKAHQIEHSIEALIPFLQYFNPGVKITPVMIPQIAFDRMDLISEKLSGIILNYIKENRMEIGRDIFFLISNDANHYGEDFGNSPYGMDAAAHKKGTGNDIRIINENLDGIIDKGKIVSLTEELWPGVSSNKEIPLWCGRYPVVFGLMTIKKIVNKLKGKEIEGDLFKYSDTFTEKVLPFRDSGMGLTAPFSYRHWCGWFSLGLYINN